jgi:hypothetical protein
MAHKPGKINMPQPEKHQHTQHLNDVLSDALNNWDPNTDPSNVIIQFEATISPNPGGVSQYRCRLVPGPTP